MFKNTVRLLMLAVLAAMLTLIASCTIRDDNGTPIDPGQPPVVPGDPTNPGGEPGEQPGTQPIPHFEFLPDSAYIRPGDTLTVNFILWADTGSNAIPLTKANVEISGDAGDYLSTGSLQTNAQGRGTVRFSSNDDNDGLTRQTELTFRYNALQAKLQLRVSSEPPRYTSISASPSILAADGSSKSIITMQVKNDRNNPIVGDTIRFQSSHGLITGVGVTDTEGKATAELTSGKSNVTATVTAYLKNDATLSESIRVEFSGVTMTASATPTSIKPTGDSSIVRVTLVDAAGNPIVGERGMTFRASVAGVTVTPYANETNARGEMTALVKTSGATVSEVTIIATAPNANITASTVIRFSSNKIVISPAQTNSYIGEQSSFTISYRNSSDQPINNAVLEISVTLGDNMNGLVDTLFTHKIGSPNGGTANITIDGPNFPNCGILAVRATGGDGHSNVITTGESQICFRARNEVDKLILSVSSFVIGVNAPGSNSNRAKLNVTAFDKHGNRVSNALIGFNLREGPGGGEHIVSPGTAVTSHDGTASIDFVAGTLPSQFRGVYIQASTFGLPDYPPTVWSNTIQLTIAGPPHSIAIRRNISELVKYPFTYGKVLGALVSDVNGNPVADETEVTFSAVVTGYQYFRRIPVFYTDNNGDRKWDTTSSYAGGIEPVLIKSEHRDQSRPYKPYPRFNDINMNGVPDSGNHVEPCDVQTPLMLLDDPECGGNPFADYNRNGTRDFAEDFAFPPQHPYSAMTYDELSALYVRSYTWDPINANPNWDIDWNQNGIADPQTVILIERTARTVNGIAENELVFGQSDALKVEVTIWAEANGLVTEGPKSKPEVFILPITEDDAKFWNPFE